MSSFGRAFRITTFGESHGAGVGVVIDGVPAQLALTEADIQTQLDRRRPGQSALTTQRDEKDRVRIQSGVERGVTLGTPIALFVSNEDQRPADYAALRAVPRPSHADYTYQQKYGTAASSGGGRASARETVGRVAAGAVAEKWLRDRFGVEIVAWVHSIGDVHLSDAAAGTAANVSDDSVDMLRITRAHVDASLVRCPHAATAARMISLIEHARDHGDSVGGTVMCVCRNVPAGWGEPTFDKLEALLAHAMLSIPATKGFEVGSGFLGTRIRGSAHNDVFARGSAPGELCTLTNRSGGIQGGISNGMPIYFRVAFKPPATIGVEQHTVDYDGEPVVLAAKGRHDPCVVPRAISIVECMAALVLADVATLQLARTAASTESSVRPP